MYYLKEICTVNKRLCLNMNYYIDVHNILRFHSERKTDILLSEIKTLTA